jgi:two-component system cell cycle response regulator DivK
VKTVLIVEDDPFNLKLARIILCTAGYRVLEAESAEVGLRLARERQPSVVLLDIHLPGMDGVTAAQKLRSDPCTCGAKIVALTGATLRGDRERMLLNGFDGYLAKPFRKQDLLDVVGAA